MFVPEEVTLAGWTSGFMNCTLMLLSVRSSDMNSPDEGFEKESSNVDDKETSLAKTTVPVKMSTFQSCTELSLPRSKASVF